MDLAAPCPFVRAPVHLPKIAARLAPLLVGLLCLSTPAELLRAQEPIDSNAERVLMRRIDSLQNTREAGARGRAWRQLGELYDAADHGADATNAFRASITHATAANDSVTMGAVHNNLGLQHWVANRYDSALVHFNKARDIRRARNDRVALSLVLNSLGASYYQLGYYEPALDAFTQSLEIRREEQDERGISVVLTNIGKTYHDWRQYERALPLMHEAIAVAYEQSEPVAAGYALNSLAMLHIEMGDYALAREMIDSSSAVYLASNDLMMRSDSSSGWSLNALARALVLLREGNAPGAVPLLDSVREAGARRQSVRGQARALLYLGEAYARLGQRTNALNALTRSLEFSRSVSQRVLTLDALAQLANIEESSGNTRDALQLLRAHQALRDTIFDQSTAQRIAAMEANVETQREQRENAKLRAEQQEQLVRLARGRLAMALGGVILLLTIALSAMLVHFNRKGRARELLLARTNDELKHANEDLRTALSEVRALSGLIPICAKCKKVRDDEGFWEAVETYITSRSEAVFSHSICTSCGPELYGEHWPDDNVPELRKLTDGGEMPEPARGP